MVRDESVRTVDPAAADIWAAGMVLLWTVGIQALQACSSVHACTRACAWLWVRLSVHLPACTFPSRALQASRLFVAKSPSHRLVALCRLATQRSHLLVQQSRRCEHNAGTGVCLQGLRLCGACEGDQFSHTLVLLLKHPVGGSGPDAIDILCSPDKVDKQMTRAVTNRARVPWPEAALQVSPLLIDLLKRMLHHDPQQRPTAQQVLTHAWMQTTVAPATTEARSRLTPQHAGTRPLGKHASSHPNRANNPGQASLTIAVLGTRRVLSLGHFGAKPSGRLVLQVQMELNARYDALLTKDERNTIVEELPACYADCTQAFALLKTAVSGWNASIAINEESRLVSIEYAGHVVLCSVPEKKTQNGRMSVKIKREQGTNHTVWIGMYADLRSHLSP